MLDTPLRFTPFLRPMVWGGRRLGTVLKKELPSDAAFGESWEVSDHPVHRSVVASGPLAGRSLRELMEQEREALLGPAAGRYRTFPWLVKYLDANDWLSVQVHPSDETVGTLWPGEGGKTEAWFVLDAAPESRIYAGLLPGTDEQRLRAALASGAVADCLYSFTPRPGDCIFLPAGTVHAVGGGVLIAEIQQTSDATFRLFDWNRRDAQGKSRALHIEESMQAIDWGRGPVEPQRVSEAEETAGQPLVQCPYFHLSYQQGRTPFPCGGEGRLQVLMALRGGGRLRSARGEQEIRSGQTWVIPAGVGSVACVPEPALGVLVSTLP